MPLDSLSDTCALLKSALQAGPQCRDETLQRLSAVLAENKDEVQGVIKPKKGLKSTSQPSQSRPNQRHATVKKPSPTTVVQNGGEILSSQDKEILAREVFNTALSILSQAVKIRNDQRSSASAHIQSNGSKSACNSSTCLSERSPNKPPTNSKKKITSKGPNSPATNTQASRGLETVAECGAVAVRYLLRNDSEASTGTKSDNFDLETAHLAFIRKIVALDHIKKARIELHEVRKRLNYRIMCPKNNKPNDVTNDANTKLKLERQSIEDVTALLDFTAYVVPASAISIVTDFQSLVLKAIIATASTNDISRLVDHLDFSSLNSLSALLVRLGDISELEHKATRQLESLSQSLISVCIKFGNKTEKETNADSTLLSSLVCFKLQATALQARCHWMSIARHECDVASEILQPFSKHLSRFTAKARSEKSIYDTATEAANKLLGLLPTMKDVTSEYNKDYKKHLLDIYYTLSDLAKTCSKLEEAERWIKLCQEQISGSVEFDTNLDRNSLKLATLYISNTDAFSYDKTRDQIEAALLTINTETAQSPTDSHPMIQDMVSLVKASLKFIQMAPKEMKIAKGSSLYSLYQKTQQLLRGLARSFRTFLENLETQKMSAKSTNPDALQKLILEKSKLVMESILFYVARDVRSAHLSWSVADDSLQDCLALLRTYSAEKMKINPCCACAEDAKSSLFVKLSTLYWTCYISLKEGANTKDYGLLSAIEAVNRSCEVLRDRCSFEKDVGSFSPKLQKLASIYLERHEIRSARSALVESLKSQMNTGLVENLSAAAKKSSIYMLGRDNPQILRLLSSLQSVLDIDLKQLDRDETSHEGFDEPKLDPELRGLFLEWQLAALLKNQRTRKGVRGSQQLAKSVFHRLLQIYSESSYPLRRRRVILKILHLQSTSSSNPDTEILQMAEECLGKDLKGQLGLDTELVRYSNHIIECLRLFCGLGSSGNTHKSIQDTLSDWKVLIEGCSSFSEVEQIIEDPDGWQEQLEVWSDYQASRGYLTQQINTKTILLKLEQIKPGSALATQLNNILDIGSSFFHEGYYEEASTYITKASDKIRDSSTDPNLILRYQVLKLKYLMANNLISDCGEHLQEIRRNFRYLHETLTSSTSRTTLKIGTLVLAADCQLVHARFYLETGQYNQALNLIKSSVTSLQRLWKSLASRKNLQSRSLVKDYNPERAPGSSCSNEDSVTNHTERQEDESSSNSATDPALWLLLPKLFESLMKLSKMFFFLGNFQDAIYHCESAQKLAEDVSSNILKGRTLRRIGDYRSRGAELSDGKQLLSCALEALSSETTNLELVWSHCSLGYHYRLHGDQRLELESYDNADTILSNLFEKRPLGLGSGEFVHGNQTPDSLSKSLQNLQLNEKSELPTPKSKSGNAPKNIRSIKPSQNMSDGHVGTRDIDMRQPASRIHLEINIKLLRAGTLLSQHEYEKSLSLLSQLGNISVLARESEIWRGGLYAQSLVENALASFSVDPVYSMLNESAIALPSGILVPSKATSNRNAHKSIESRAELQKGHSAQGKRPKQSNSCDGAFHTLGKAFSALERLPLEASRFSPIANVTQICSLFANVSLLQSMGSDTRMCPVCPITVAHATELPRIVAGIRDRVAAEADKLKVGSNLIEWPNGSDLAEKDLVPSCEDFQQDFVELMPSNWITVSISVDEDGQQLYFVRYEKEKSPFVLRLPLARQHTEDMDDEPFGFSDAKAELQQIIKESDSTVHGARDRPEELRKKGAKTKWWDERKALDSRLKDLLANMEGLWLGGFKGIFSVHNSNSRLLARFQKDFEQLLQKYLPSRSKSGKSGSREGFVQLDPRIYELFVGLRYDQEEENLDEILTDLLYFVVDIMQFNGERNAYDEIDFDSLIIETIDALQSYHQAAEAETATKADPDKHIILALDKELHIFPWECLPCLSGRSVSRVTSLLDLRERILTMQQAIGGSSTKYTISSNKGTYILNPSTDLVKTQSRFEGPLSTLCDKDWSYISQRGPSEDEFAAALDPDSGGDILLYFGHGAGTQYIRRRRIGQLRRPGRTSGAGCTTTLLFGCSSASLKEAGEFEPYGTPKSYLLAGAPALVGALWDITDGDCDLFAKGVLSRWGLLDFPDEGETTESSGRKSGNAGRPGKAKAARNKVTRLDKDKDTETETDDARMSLSDAVARSRTDCYLGYLNGAAMVVYGVPVYLSL